MVGLGVSVIFHCSTTTAFMPLAAFPLASPLCRSGTHTVFLGYSSLTATPALALAVLLPLLWPNSDLLTFPAPMVHY